MKMVCRDNVNVVVEFQSMSLVEIDKFRWDFLRKLRRAVDEDPNTDFSVLFPIVTNAEYDMMYDMMVLAAQKDQDDWDPKMAAECEAKYTD
jgi:hypothetical protein